MATKKWVRGVAVGFCLMGAIALGGEEAVERKWKSLERGGMEFRYRFAEDELHCVMRSPARGWVAVGFNPRAGLTGTNLILGAVRQGQVRLSDRFIFGPGDHRAVSDAGGTDRLRSPAGFENEIGTEISFRIPLAPPENDVHHYRLKPGATLHLLMAYSLEDDFAHHSVFRTSVPLSL